MIKSCADSSLYLGIDLGGTRIRGVIAGVSGEILGFRESLTPGPAPEIDEAVAGMTESLASDAGVSVRSLGGICIGSAGSLDRKAGMILFAPNLPSLVRWPLTENLERRTGAPVFLENDAFAALTGVGWKGEGGRYRDWILILQGTGLGGGAVSDNRAVRGRFGSTMEIGHMTVDMDGKECRCGNRGCLELYASGTGLVDIERDIRRETGHTGGAGEREPTARSVAERARKGDAAALKAFSVLTRYLAAGVMNLVHLFNPEAVIFGGGLSESHDLYLAGVAAAVKEKALPGFRENIDFLPVGDRSKIPALGAAKLAMDRGAPRS